MAKGVGKDTRSLPYLEQKPCALTVLSGRGWVGVEADHPATTSNRNAASWSSLTSGSAQIEKNSHQSNFEIAVSIYIALYKYKK